MVDPGLVDLKSLGDEVRFRIFDYLWGKGVRSSELGIDPTYANKIKNRKARVSDALLERMLRMLSVDEFAVLVGSSTAQQALQQPTVREPQSLGEAAIALDQHVRALELVLEKYPQLSNIAYQKLAELLKARVRGYSVTVTGGHVEVFEKLLKSKAPKTREERLRYLRRALEDLGWELLAERLQEYIAELQEESPHVARHVARTLTPRQTTHIKEALLKGEITIAHPGCKGKTIIVKPQTTKNTTGSTKHINNNINQKRKTLELDNKYTKESLKTTHKPKLIYVTLGYRTHKLVS